MSRRPLLDQRRPALLLLLLITLVAAILRFYKLGAWSFWGDEMLSVSDVSDGFNYSVWRQSLALTLIRATIGSFGLSEWTARLAPALIGVLSIPILYFPIRRLWGTAVALLSVLLLAISPWHIYWSQNARFYSLLLLFYTLAMLLLYLGLAEKRPFWLLIGLLFLGLAARERLVALFFVPALTIYLASLWLWPGQRPLPRREWRRFLPILAGGGLLALAFAWPYLQNLAAWRSGFGFVNNNPFWLAAGVAYYVRLTAVCLAVGGSAYLLSRGDRAGLYLGLNAILPLLLLMILATFQYSANRYVFMTLPAWLILAATAVVTLWRQVGRQGRWLALSLLLLLLLDPLSEDVLYYRYQNGNRDNWRAAFALIANEKGPDDLIVSPHRELGQYYLGQPTRPLSGVDVTDVAAGRETVWFVEDLTVGERYPAVQRWLRTEAELVGVFDVVVQARTFTMRVYRYQPPG